MSIPEQEGTAVSCAMGRSSSYYKTPHANKSAAAIRDFQRSVARPVRTATAAEVNQVMEQQKVDLRTAQ
jgi:hypothetical protein